MTPNHRSHQTLSGGPAMKVVRLVVVVTTAGALQQQTRLGGRPGGRSGFVPRRDAAVTPRAGEDLVSLVNSEAPGLVSKLVLDRSEVGKSIAAANRMSGGSQKLEGCEVTEFTADGNMEFAAKIRKRKPFGKYEIQETAGTVALWEEPQSDLRKRMVDLACELGANREAAKLLDAEPPKSNLWLNNVPARGPTRRYFADAASEALVSALSETGPRRLQMIMRPPELDDELDTYRVGTLLELTRSLTLAIVSRLGLRVRVCVQQATGTGTFQGLPLSLNGVRRLLESMDWGPSGEDLFRDKYVRFGALSSKEEDVDDFDDVFLVLCPQSTVGSSVVDLLRDLADAVPDKPVVLFNPKLKDVQSSQGVMSVRGRADRLAFAAQFQELYRFNTVVPTGRTFFPILGAVLKPSLNAPYCVYSRRETGLDQSQLADSAAKAKAVDDGLLVESYAPVAAFADLPDSGTVLSVLNNNNNKAIS